MTLFSRFSSLLCYLVVISQIDFVFFCLLAMETCCFAKARLLLYEAITDGFAYFRWSGTMPLSASFAKTRLEICFTLGDR